MFEEENAAGKRIDRFVLIDGRGSIKYDYKTSYSRRAYYSNYPLCGRWEHVTKTLSFFFSIRIIARISFRTGIKYWRFISFFEYFVFSKRVPFSSGLVRRATFSPTFPVLSRKPPCVFFIGRARLVSCSPQYFTLGRETTDVGCMLMPTIKTNIGS